MKKTVFWTSQNNEGKILAPKKPGQGLFGKRKVDAKTYYCSHTIRVVSCSMYKVNDEDTGYCVSTCRSFSTAPVCFYICIKYRSSLTDTVD